MSKFFIAIYDWFDNHKAILYTVLASLTAFFCIFAFQIDFNENISSFFGEDEKSSAVFDKIKIKDRIIVMVTGDDSDAMIEAGEAFADSLGVLIDEGLVSSVTRGADDGVISGSVDFIYDYLPIFIEDSDYERLDSCLTDDCILQSVRNVYNLLVSPSGIVVRDMVLRDPLSIGTHLLKRFERFSGDMEYEMYAGHIFSKDMSMMLMFIEPSNSMGNTGDNARLVQYLETKAAETSAKTGTNISCIGGPIVAVYNANQIKKDTGITLSLALVVIILFIMLSFKNRRTVPLIILPPAFGALFALAMIYFVQGGVSAIAIGAGAVVLGISLSYSIHVVAHSNHTYDPRQIIRDLAYPLTVGSLTTIGAFAALMFTNSPLLKDMGLFSVFCLIGTDIFCLVFLPHFIKKTGGYGDRPLLKWIEKVNGKSYENHKWLVACIAIITIVCLFFYSDVRFDSDMSNINFMPEHIVEAETKLEESVGTQKGEILVACSSKDLSDASDTYIRLDSLIVALQNQEKLSDYISVKDFVISPAIQQEKIDKWNKFWESRRDNVINSLQKASVETGFRPSAFADFEEILTKEYKICDYSEEALADVTALADWINPSDDGILLISRIKIDDRQKDQVYAMMDEIGGISVIDRAYFSSKMVSDTSDDFDYILIISSLIVFLALLLSYGRIELAAMAFLPMCISWVIILGFMALLGIKFNIVNVILATFIFGIGDDFSIFIMDGLLQEYKDGQKTLASHKTAIFFSAFTTIVGMGAMIFAKHPALKSIAVISVLGIAVVVFVSYTIQPFLFRKLITNPTRKGGFPYTLGSILNTAYAFIYFFIGCVIARTYRLIQYCLPISKEKKKTSYHKLLYGITRTFLATMITVRTKRLNPHEETFEKPAVIIANHQSFVDILLMLSTNPKIIMLTNSWVWNSPFFGKIVQYADFYHTGDGYEALVDSLKDRVREGYSVLVFPEGTRSADSSILRFHKGAFYLAKELQMDILPIMIYGPGNVCSKKQGFYIKHGMVLTKILPRIKYGDESFGVNYQEQAKNLRVYFKNEFAIVNDEFRRTSDTYFRDALIKNYIYKGPVLEWYMRIKSKIDGYYDLWDRIVPRNAVMTDVGCGYGQLSFMLGTLSPDRKITGLDYDEEKIALAQHSFLRKDNLRFEHADMVTCEMPQSDVFIFNDSLHYVNEASQKTVLEHCLARLNDGGMLVVRDGDASNSEQHRHILETERWSTQIIGFNRTRERLTFVTKGWMQEFADSHNLELKVRKCDGKTSEMLYIFKRK